MDSCNSDSSIDSGWECVSEVNSDIISLNTLGSTAEPATKPGLHRQESRNRNVVFGSYCVTLQRNIGNEENEVSPSTDFIPLYERTRKSANTRDAPFPSNHHSTFFIEDEHHNDHEIRKSRQAQKRRRDRILSQTRRKNRFSDKKSQTNFHSMKRCCVRSQPSKQLVVQEDHENLYVPHATHKSLTWWDCGARDNDLRMARPRWNV